MAGSNIATISPARSLPASEAEAAEPFVRADITDHRPPTSDGYISVCPAGCPVDVIWCLLVFNDERDLSAGAIEPLQVCRGWVLHAALLFGGCAGIALGAFEVHRDFAMLGFPLAPIAEGFSSGTDANQIRGIKREFACRNDVFSTLAR